MSQFSKHTHVVSNPQWGGKTLRERISTLHTLSLNPVVESKLSTFTQVLCSSLILRCLHFHFMLRYTPIPKQFNNSIQYCLFLLYYIYLTAKVTSYFFKILHKLKHMISLWNITHCLLGLWPLTKASDILPNSDFPSKLLTNTTQSRTLFLMLWPFGLSFRLGSTGLNYLILY